MSQRLPGIKPWVLLATVLGTGVFLYWASLGASYMAIARGAASLEDEVALRAAGITPPASSHESALQAEVAGQRFQSLSARFQRHDSETTVEMVFQEADAIGVEVTVLAMGKTSTKMEDGVLFQIQPLTIRLNGSHDKVVSFLDGLHQRMPALVLADAHLSSSGAAPTAQLQLVLYVSPQAAP